ncbi:MAG: metal-dependent transcriptional regulator [Firmicutes bacterium]|nr:metal-dependent transcriptional regulator [Bacillota bacterium]MCL5039809.1 metal-dependent transcriptional regulator [Bacillota bacterium]
MNGIVYQLLEEACEYLYGQKGPVPMTELAGGIGLELTEVEKVLGELQKQGLVSVNGQGITLTSKGEKLGQRIARKHNLLERFLLALGLKKREAHDEACLLEHSLSDSLEAELNRRLPGPSWEKRGKDGQAGADFDPQAHGEAPLALTDLKDGQVGVIEAIYGGQKVRQRLNDLGLTPGTAVTLLRKGPGGPVELRVRETTLALGRGIASKIFLRKMEWDEQGN